MALVDSIHSSISKFILNQSIYHLRLDWKKTHFELVLTNGNFMWQGIAETAYIKDKLLPQGMKFENYMELVHEALFKQDTLEEKFSYSIKSVEKNSENIELCWKIKLGLIQETGLNFYVKGFLELERITDLTKHSLLFQSFFDLLLNKSSTLEIENKKIKTERESLIKQRDDALKLSKVLSQEKLKQEKEFYIKFVLVLNEKKKKIKELRIQLDNALKNGPPKSSKSSNPPKDKPSISLTSQPSLDLFPSQTLSGASSLSFNNTDPTPSLDLFEETDYDLQTTVRKRQKTSVNPSTIDFPPGNQQSMITLVKPQSKTFPLSNHLTSPSKKNSLDSSFTTGGENGILLSPALCTPSPAKRFKKKSKNSEMEADDLLGMLSE